MCIVVVRHSIYFARMVKIFFFCGHKWCVMLFSYWPQCIPCIIFLVSFSPNHNLSTIQITFSYFPFYFCCCITQLYLLYMEISVFDPKAPIFVTISTVFQAMINIIELQLIFGSFNMLRKQVIWRFLVRGLFFFSFAVCENFWILE